MRADFRPGDRHEARTRLLGDRRLAKWLFAVSITWFLFDFADYGDTIASDSIVSKVAKHATPLQTSAIELGISQSSPCPRSTAPRSRSIGLGAAVWKSRA